MPKRELIPAFVAVLTVSAATDVMSQYYGYGALPYGYGGSPYDYGASQYGYGGSSYNYGASQYGYGGSPYGYGVSPYGYDTAPYGYGDSSWHYGPSLYDEVARDMYENRVLIQDTRNLSRMINQLYPSGGRAAYPSANRSGSNPNRHACLASCKASCPEPDVGTGSGNLGIMSSMDCKTNCVNSCY